MARGSAFNRYPLCKMSDAQRKIAGLLPHAHVPLDDVLGPCQEACPFVAATFDLDQTDGGRIGSIALNGPGYENRSCAGSS